MFSIYEAADANMGRNDPGTKKDSTRKIAAKIQGCQEAYPAFVFLGKTFLRPVEKKMIFLNNSLGCLEEAEQVLKKENEIK